MKERESVSVGKKKRKKMEGWNERQVTERRERRKVENACKKKKYQNEGEMQNKKRGK